MEKEKTYEEYFDETLQKIVDRTEEIKKIKRADAEARRKTDLYGIDLYCADGKFFGKCDIKEKYEHVNGVSKIYVCGRGWGYLNDQNKLLFDKFFKNVSDFNKEGFAYVEDTNGRFVIDKTGKKYLSSIYRNVDFRDGLHYVGRSGIFYKYMTDEGKKISVFDHYDAFYKYRNLNGYVVKKHPFKKGYVCDNGTDRFEVKHTPLKIFGNRFVICMDFFPDDYHDYIHGYMKDTVDTNHSGDNKSYIYDREYDDYIEVNIGYYGKNYFTVRAADLSCKNGRISIPRNADGYDIFYILAYNNNLYDMSDFFGRNGYSYYSASKFSIEDFSIRLLTEEEYDLKEDKEETDDKLSELLKVKEEQTSIEENIILEKQKALEEFKNKMEEINNRQNSNKKKRIVIDDLLISVGDHFIVSPIYRDLLDVIDLSMVNFDNVDVAGLNFSNTNARINPQTVYNKDLSNCDFTGIYVDSITFNIAGVNVCGTKFSKDKDMKTYDMMPDFSSAIYDASTTYNGASIYSILGIKVYTNDSN